MARMPSCCSNATSASASRVSLGQKRKMLSPGMASEDAVLPLADHKNIVRVRIRFDLGHLRAGLRSDHNSNSALIQISNSVECLFRIELRIANKESDQAG